MLSLELADALFRAAGDCHVLLVGDTDQLPPIGPGRVLADLVESDVGAARPPDRDLPPGCALPHHPQRPPHQRRPAAVPLARRGARRRSDEQELDEDFFWISRSGPETLREAVLELVCEALPRRGFDPRTEVMTLVPMRRGIVGLTALNAELEQRLNPRGTPVVRELRVGSRIVQTRNDYTPEREVMNGEVAFVLAWDEEEGEALLSLDDGEREVVVPASALETYELAWALTIHRAQGSQFPAVVAPWSSAVPRDAVAAAPLHRGDPRAATLRTRRRATGAADRGRARARTDAPLLARRTTPVAPGPRDGASPLSAAGRRLWSHLPPAMTAGARPSSR